MVITPCEGQLAGVHLRENPAYFTANARIFCAAYKILTNNGFGGWKGFTDMV